MAPSPFLHNVLSTPSPLALSLTHILQTQAFYKPFFFLYVCSNKGVTAGKRESRKTGRAKTHFSSTLNYKMS